MSQHVCQLPERLTRILGNCSRRLVLKFPVAGGSIFEWQLHFSGSQPTATIKVFTSELWSNRDFGEHSCQGNVYLCCCLSAVSVDRWRWLYGGRLCLHCPLFSKTSSQSDQKSLSSPVFCILALNGTDAETYWDITRKQSTNNIMLFNKREFSQLWKFLCRCSAQTGFVAL